MEAFDYLSGLFDNYSKPIAVFDINKQLRYSNKSFKTIHFIDEDDSQHSSFKKPAELNDYLDRSLADDTITITVELGDNAYYNLHTSIVQGLRVCVMVWDHKSEWESIAKEKSANEKDLINQNIVKDRIFSVIAHDLKNPMGTIEQVSKILDSNFESFSRSELKDYITDIYTTARSASNLLETLLAWADVQKGTVKFDPSETNLRMITAKCCELTAVKARLKNILLANDISEDLTVYADPKLVYTILRNLITNSMKFTEEGGTISIRTRLLSTDFVQIEVVDTGIGMTREKASQLFSMNRVASTLGTENEEGTGLGLVLCKDFVDMHGGSICAESDPGHGTTVYFTLPHDSEVFTRCRQ